MGTTSATTKAATRGRPRSSKLSRTQQLRLAKQAQRERDALANQTEARIKLPRPLAQRLLFATRQPGFIDSLSQFLDSETVEVERYPQLKLLCWHRRDRLLRAEDAWSLYERNWRFVEPAQLEPAEKRLIDMLNTRFGGGLHA
ncbi:MAG: hypothetical protein ACKVQK_25540 [Burkholderiales bacterium]